MPKKLKSLTVTAVSLVPKGSNPLAHIAFFKTAAPVADDPAPEPGPVGKATFNEILLAEQRRKALWKIADSIYTMQEAMYSSVYSDSPTSDIRKSVTQFSAYVEKLLTALESNSLDGDADVLKQQVQKKAEGVFARFFNQEPTTMSKSIATPPAAAPQAEPQAINLAELPENVQAFIRAQQTQTEQALATAKSAQESADRTAAALTVEKEAREMLEFTAVAKAELTHLPGTPEEKGAVLASLKRSLTDEEYTKAFALLKAGAAAMTEQTLAKGVDASSGVVSPDSAQGQLDLLATEFQKGDPKMQRAVALSKAYKARPDLYKVVAAEEMERGSRVNPRRASH